MRVNLIIDGNYLLSKLVFTLHKHNLLYGGLHKALETTILNYRRLFPFSSVYLVSDSREKSWRKDFAIEYKGTRKKDSDIDWKFVYEAYGEFKETLKNFNVLEYPRVEGDDWISFLVDKSNKEGISTMIISNDYDIKQLLIYSLDPLFINMMTNEMFNKEKLFLPSNYQLFINSLNKLDNTDIFSLNDNSEFYNLMNRLITKYEVHEIDNVDSLIVKIISGDSSDNIKSVWSVEKDGKRRGIGDAGAKTILKEYKVEFGEVDLKDIDLNENIADLICEKKKLSKGEIPGIVKRIEENFRLIDLKIDNIPTDLFDKMIELYNECRK